MMALLKPSLPKQPNPYVMAVITAVLAGAFAVLGTYFTAQFQAKHAIAQKQLEYRAQSYAAFLEKIDRSRSPEFGIDWSAYPSDVSRLRAKWAEVQKEGITYGWQPRISNDKRLMIIVVGKLFELLVTELRNELQTPAST